MATKQPDAANLKLRRLSAATKKVDEWGWRMLIALVAPRAVDSRLAEPSRAGFSSRASVQQQLRRDTAPDAH